MKKSWWASCDRMIIKGQGGLKKFHLTARFHMCVSPATFTYSRHHPYNWILYLIITTEVLHLSWRRWTQVRHLMSKMLTPKAFNTIANHFSNIPPENRCEKCRNKDVVNLSDWGKAASLRCYQTFGFDLLTRFTKESVQIKMILYHFSESESLSVTFPYCFRTSMSTLCQKWGWWCLSLLRGRSACYDDDDVDDAGSWIKWWNTFQEDSDDDVAAGAGCKATFWWNGRKQPVGPWLPLEVNIAF